MFLLTLSLLLRLAHHRPHHKAYLDGMEPSENVTKTKQKAGRSETSILAEVI